MAINMSIQGAVPLRGGVVITGSVSLPSGRPIPLSALVIGNTVSWGLAGAYGAWSDPSGAVWLLGPGATSFTPDDAGPGGKEVMGWGPITWPR